MRMLRIIAVSFGLSLGSCLALKGVERREESSAAGPTTSTGDDSPVTNITFQSVGGSAGWVLLVPMAWLAWRNRVAVRTVDRLQNSIEGSVDHKEIKRAIRLRTGELDDSIEKLIQARLRKRGALRRSGP